MTSGIAIGFRPFETSSVTVAPRATFAAARGDSVTTRLGGFAENTARVLPVRPKRRSALSAAGAWRPATRGTVIFAAALGLGGEAIVWIVAAVVRAGRPLLCREASQAPTSAAMTRTRSTTSHGHRSRSGGGSSIGTPVGVGAVAGGSGAVGSSMTCVASSESVTRPRTSIAGLISPVLRKVRLRP